MATICKSLDGFVFDGLDNFEAATDKFFGMPEADREQILGACKDHILAHGLQDIVAIDLKHRHFAMPEGKILCEEINIETMRSVMKPTSPDQLSNSPTPFAFKCSDGVWLPYEFVSNSSVAADRLEAVSQNAGFADGLADILTTAGMEDVLGFHVLHRDDLSKEARGTIETPGDSDHELLIRPYSEDLYQELSHSESGFHSHPVMWFWPAQAKGPKTHGCIMCYCNHCSSHCNSHRKK